LKKISRKEFIEIVEKHSNVDYVIPIQQRLIDVLKKKGNMSRDEICEEFGYKKKIIIRYEKRTTIYDNLLKLEKKGKIKRFDINNGKRGRSITMWKLME